MMDRALASNTHSTMSAFDSPSVFQTARSASFAPVTRIRVPAGAPLDVYIFSIRPKLMRFGGTW